MMMMIMNIATAECTGVDRGSSQFHLYSPQDFSAILAHVYMHYFVLFIILHYTRLHDTTGCQTD